MGIDEAIKALRCEENLESEACEDCHYGKEGGLCLGVDRDAADLLEQQQTEIKQITKDRDEWRAAAEASRDVIQPKLRAEIAELKAENKKLKPFDKMREFMMFSSPEEMQKYCVHIQSLNDKLKTESEQLNASHPVGKD